MTASTGPSLAPPGTPAAAVAAREARGGPSGLAARRARGGGGRLPLIDLGPFVHGDSEQRRPTPRRTACESNGLCYLGGHGIPAGLIEAALDASRRFFALPEHTKRASIGQPGRYRGYLPRMPLSRDEGSGQPYRCEYEAIIAGPEVVPDDPACLARGALHGPKVWPDARSGKPVGHARAPSRGRSASLHQHRSRPRAPEPADRALTIEHPRAQDDTP